MTQENVYYFYMICFICKKTVLVPFKCNCDNIFCVKHKLPEKHYCGFDFKTKKEHLEKVETKKIESI